MRSIWELNELMESLRSLLKNMERGAMDRPDRFNNTEKPKQKEDPKETRKSEELKKVKNLDGKERPQPKKPEEKSDPYDHNHSKKPDLNCETKKPAVNEEPEVTLPPAPELEKPFFGIKGDVTYWGFSQRGNSHIKKNVPCQDRCRVDFSEGRYSLLIAAIADGVGSCALSHYGADIATKAAVSYLKTKISQYTDDTMEDKWIGDSLREAMQYALDSVAKAAEEMKQLEYSFQSTLTIAIYDEAGLNLYVGHAGDDGLVALNNEGKIAMVTSRLKGEEISSVYPLQAGPAYWQVLKASNVNAFIMATDGVLDSFVRPENEDNRIYYPLIQPALEVSQSDIGVVERTMKFYYNFMEGEDYRVSVTDDLTIVVVRNQPLINKNNVPKFSVVEWGLKSKEYREKVQKALYPDLTEKDSDQPEKPERTQTQSDQLEKPEEPQTQPDQIEKPEEPQTQPDQIEKPEEPQTQPDQSEKPEEAQTQPDQPEKPEEAQTQVDQPEKPEEVQAQVDQPEKPEEARTQVDQTEKLEEAQMKPSQPVNSSQSEPGLKVIPPIRNHGEKDRYHKEKEDTSESGKTGRRLFVKRIRNKRNDEGGR